MTHLKFFVESLRLLILSLFLLLIIVFYSFVWNVAPPIDEDSSAIDSSVSIIPDEIAQGKALFKSNCASCHNKNMKDDMTGPALIGVKEAWQEFPKEDFYRWIQNSQQLIDEGHPRAVQLWKAWKPTIMTPFPNLTKEDIDAIMEYINNDSRVRPKY